MNIRADIDPAASTAIPTLPSDKALASAMSDLELPIRNLQLATFIAVNVFNSAFGQPDDEHVDIVKFSLTRLEWEAIEYAISETRILADDLRDQYLGAYKSALALNRGAS